MIIHQMYKMSIDILGKDKLVVTSILNYSSKHIYVDNQCRFHYIPHICQYRNFHITQFKRCIQTTHADMKRYVC